jgi:hypothetical protein
MKLADYASAVSGLRSQVVGQSLCVNTSDTGRGSSSRIRNRDGLESCLEVEVNGYEQRLKGAQLSKSG